MRRKLSALTVLILVLAGLFVLPASAENAAQRVDTYCTMNSEGDCLVSMSVTIHLDAGDDSLMFPLPANATSITMNGYSAATTKSSSVTYVNLSRATSGLPGDFTIRFDYLIPKVVYPVADETRGKGLEMSLPIMGSFSFPVTSFTFTITFPSEVTTTPAFSSTYRQNSIEADLDYVVRDNMITGSIVNGLNDHEAFSLTMPVETSMFPSVSTYQRSGNPEVVPMLIVLGAALAALGGWAMVCAAGAVFARYYQAAKKQFGGTTGDMAGWFLQKCEIWMLAALAACQWLGVL